MRILFADKGKDMYRTRATNWLLVMAFVVAGGHAPAGAVENFMAPAKYKELITDGDIAKTLRARLALVGPLEVSPLRPSLLTQPGEWTACVKVVSQGLLPPGAEPESADAPKRPAAKKKLPPSMPVRQGPVTVSYYAIFFRSGEIVDGRRSVLVDHCEQLQYSPLPKPSKPKADLTGK